MSIKYKTNLKTSIQNNSYHFYFYSISLFFFCLYNDIFNYEWLYLFTVNPYLIEIRP